MTSVSALSSGLTPGTAASALSGTSPITADSSLTNALTGTNGSPNASSAIGDTTSAALQQISDQIAALTAQASSNVQAFDKTSQDVLYDNNATARSIGQLRLNTTRLNVISALTPQDNVDTFTFTATTSGASKLSALINDPKAADQTADASGDVRIQLFAKGKGLVADSASSAGDANKNYQALQSGTFNLSAGQYTIRITRADGVDPQAKNSYNYAVQLSQGTTYSQDFTTTEQAYNPSSGDPFGIGLNNDNSPGAILSGALSDSYSFIASLQPIGQSGTSKLLGFIYTTSA